MARWRALCPAQSSQSEPELPTPHTSCPHQSIYAVGGTARSSLPGSLAGDPGAFKNSCPVFFYAESSANRSCPEARSPCCWLSFLLTLLRSPSPTLSQSRAPSVLGVRGTCGLPVRACALLTLYELCAAVAAAGGMALASTSALPGVLCEHTEVSAIRRRLFGCGAPER